MVRRFALFFPILLFAFGILFASVYRVANIKPQISPFNSPVLAATDEEDVDKPIDIDYKLPFPGKILPDNPLWYLKVVRDRLWLFFTFDPMRKADLNLLFADKRLWASKMLFEKGKSDLGLSTLTKAEKYLEEASKGEGKERALGVETKNFLITLSKSSLKHRQTIEEILLLAPEDLRPGIIKVEDYSKNVYKSSRDTLNSKGFSVPNNPFDQE